MEVFESVEFQEFYMGVKPSYLNGLRTSAYDNIWGGCNYDWTKLHNHEFSNLHVLAFIDMVI
jgi:hypothetical protein